MNCYEKIAWFDLAVLSVSFVLYLIGFLLLRMKYDFFMSAQIASTAFAVIALCAFGPLMFNKTGLIVDEQGATIRKKQRSYKYLIFWGVYLSIFIGLWVWMKIVGTISDEVKVLLVFTIVSILALMAFTHYLYFQRQKETSLVTDEQNISDVVLFGPDMDERDLMIQKKGLWNGFGALWFVYVFGIMGTWGLAHNMGYHTISIDVSLLPFFVFVAFILIFTVDTITRVILYRRGK